MLTRSPDAADEAAERDALAAFGLKKQAHSSAPRRETFPLWAEHALALAVFRRSLTQWYVGMAGATGLRYSSARLVFDAMGGAAAAWLDTLEELQVLEQEALEVWAEAKEQRGE